MLVHIVLFTWKEDVSQSQVDALTRAIGNLPEQIPELQQLRFGPDVKLRAGNADYGLVATFADQAGWNAYQASTAHKALIAEYITPILASRVAIQMSGSDLEEGKHNIAQ